MTNTQLNIFAGAAYDPVCDAERLTKQVGRIEKLMLDGKWRTLSQMESELKELYPDKYHPQASISAQLRNMKKLGTYLLDKRIRGTREIGLWEYKLMVK
jgi:hypothetical protein